jgi:hypothetical protein
VVLAKGLRPVALGQVRLDQRSVSALAQGLRGHRGKPAFYRQGITPSGGEPFAQRLEGMQPDLAEPLLLDVSHSSYQPGRRSLESSLRQAQVRCGGYHRVYAFTAKAPQGRAQASAGAPVRDVQPELSGYGAPAHRALLYRQVGEQALDGNGQRYPDAVHPELEIIEQAEHEAGYGPASPGAAVASGRLWFSVHDRHDGN